MADQSLPENMEYDCTINIDDQRWKFVLHDDDLTLYWSVGEAKEICLDKNRISIKPKAQTKNTNEEKEYNPFQDKSWDGTVKLTNKNNDNHWAIARANIVSSHGGRRYSGTFRISSRGTDKSDIKAMPSWPPLKRSRFLVDGCEYSKVILNYLDVDKVKIGGTIVISGTTGSRKSTVAKSIIWDLIESHVHENISKRKRLPHLVTFEDPIEGWDFLAEHGEGNKEKLKFLFPHITEQYGFNITPRVLKQDVDTLEKAFEDAKRQTPKCFYVGEVRNKDDWRHILEFGSSGHLVIATTHASSVVETISKIQAGCKAKAPSARRQWLNSLQGVIHLRAEKIPILDNDKIKQEAIFPAIWKGSAEALNGLVSVGLSSVTPNLSYYCSRSHFFDSQFCKAIDIGTVFPDKSWFNEHDTSTPLTPEGILKTLSDESREFDLQELRGK